MRPMKKHAQSLIDYLLPQMPGVMFQIHQKETVPQSTARKLFSIWRDENNRISEKSYRRPVTVSASDVESLEKADLVRAIGDRIEITKKGTDVIKVMILGDDSSSLDKIQVEVNFQQALANTKIKTVKKAKIAQKTEDLWWGQFK